MYAGSRNLVQCCVRQPIEISTTAKETKLDAISYTSSDRPWCPLCHPTPAHLSFKLWRIQSMTILTIHSSFLSWAARRNGWTRTRKPNCCWNSSKTRMGASLALTKSTMTGFGMMSNSLVKMQQIRESNGPIHTWVGSLQSCTYCIWTLVTAPRIKRTGVKLGAVLRRFSRDFISRSNRHWISRLKKMLSKLQRQQERLSICKRLATGFKTESILILGRLTWKPALAAVICALWQYNLLKTSMTSTTKPSKEHNHKLETWEQLPLNQRGNKPRAPSTTSEQVACYCVKNHCLLALDGGQCYLCREFATATSF